MTILTHTRPFGGRELFRSIKNLRGGSPRPQARPCRHQHANPLHRLAQLGQLLGLLPGQPTGLFQLGEQPARESHVDELSGEALNLSLQTVFTANMIKPPRSKTIN